MRSKYILQYGNVAGWPYYYAVALKKLGIDSISVKAVSEESYIDLDGNIILDNRKLPTDKVIYNKQDMKIVKLYKKINFIANCLFDCRLIHCYGGAIMSNNSDAFLFNKLNIPMIISWAGSDARIVSMARKNNPYFYREPDEVRDKSIQKRLESIARYIHFVATDVEMATYTSPFFKKVFILRQPVDMTEIIFNLPDKNPKSPFLLHIPTSSKVKGTTYIENAIERLKSDGLSFEFKKMQANLTQVQAKQEISKCDIYIDELHCGSYGQTAVESMASGKPTISYIREDLIEKYPKDLPLVNANPDNIYQKLKELILDHELRYEIGIKSRKFAEKYHSLEVVGPELLKIYKEIGLKDSH